jgi:hypothetical protein
MFLLFAGYKSDNCGGLEDLESVHVDFNTALNEIKFSTEHYDWYHILDTETLNMKFYDNSKILTHEKTIKKYSWPYNIESIYP